MYTWLSMNDIIMSSHSLPLYTLAGKYLKVRVTGHEFQNKYSSHFLTFVVMNMI